jgi:hypothetical protein
VPAGKSNCLIYSHLPAKKDTFLANLKEGQKRRKDKAQGARRKVEGTRFKEQGTGELRPQKPWSR